MATKKGGVRGTAKRADGDHRVSARSGNARVAVRATAHARGGHVAIGGAGRGTPAAATGDNGVAFPIEDARDRGGHDKPHASGHHLADVRDRTPQE